MHLGTYNPYTNPQTGFYFNGMPVRKSAQRLRGMGEVTSIDYGAAAPDTSSFLSTVAPVLTSAAQGYSTYLTAQQTNQGLSTISQVAMWGIAAFAAVKIFGKK